MSIPQKQPATVRQIEAQTKQTIRDLQWKPGLPPGKYCDKYEVYYGTLGQVWHRLKRKPESEQP